MSKLQTLKTGVSRVAGRSGLVMKKHSPEILMTVGVVGIVTSTVLACRATLKAEEVVETAKNKLDKIHYAKENISAEEYSEQDYQKDLVIAYVQTGVDFVKLYGPAVTLGVASIACVLGAHGIMRKRNIAIMAAYKAVEQNFSTYRKRVIEEFGEEKDRHYRTGVYAEQVTVTKVDPETGKKTKVTETVEKVDPSMVSQYARFFDKNSSQWSPQPEYNLTFLKCQQNYANDLLHARGHIFLNEVYDMLGVPRTQGGAIVGWVKGEGDDFVDFGIFDGDDEKKRAFVNGYEDSVLLDFNVAGVIYDMI